MVDKHQTFEGNPATFAQYLLSQGQRVFLISYRADVTAAILGDFPGSQFASGGSWRELWIRLRCRYVVICHGVGHARGRFRWLRSVRLINLWHGIPIKGMANLDNGYARSRLTRRSRQDVDLLTVSSALERSLMAGCHLLDAARIAVTGIPRTDMLLRAERRTLPQQRIIDELRTLKGGRRLILYAPTFRDYQRGVTGINREQWQSLDAALQRMNVLMAVRPHPTEVNQFRQLCQGLPHIVYADSARWPDANAVLVESDVLITDYSSIWLEFLLLNRPVIAFLWDHERYLSSRGLLLDLPAVFPGPVAVNFAQLLALLAVLERESFAVSSEWQRCYANVTTLFHQHQDGQSCERIVAAAHRLS